MEVIGPKSRDLVEGKKRVYGSTKVQIDDHAR